MPCVSTGRRRPSPPALGTSGNIARCPNHISMASPMCAAPWLDLKITLFAVPLLVGLIWALPRSNDDPSPEPRGPELA